MATTKKTTAKKKAPTKKAEASPALSLGELLHEKGLEWKKALREGSDSQAPEKLAALRALLPYL